jgi:hypothetical protein
MSDLSKPALRILVAGGCHVFGYPIGESKSFAAVLERELSPLADVQLTCLRASLKYSSVILETLAVSPADVLILQLGNLECPVHVRRHLRQQMHKPAGHVGGHIEVPSNAVFVPSLCSRLKSLARTLYSWLAIALGKPLFDPNGFTAAYAAMLDQIAEAGVTTVIAISPLPCVDPMHMRYRLRGAQLIRQVAESRSMLCLDSAEALGGPKASQAPQLHCHVLHLGRQGHQLLGEALAALLTRHLSLGAPPELFAQTLY